MNPSGRIRVNHRDLTSIYLMIGVLMAGVLIQATLLARVRLGGVAANLLLVIVVCWSLLRGQSEGLLWGFFGGLLLDLTAGLPLGTSSLALLAVCPLANLGKKSVFPGSLTLPVLLVLLATPVFGWVVLLTKAMVGQSVDWLAATWRVIGPEMGLNALLTLLTYPMLRRLAGATRPTAMEW
ncbi:MAG: rod shape-determining protein MreD [Anaerolineae bacterium]|nr:rod shape-determining protein MreD [Anaerolineae bacterium]